MVIQPTTWELGSFDILIDILIGILVLLNILNYEGIMWTLPDYIDWFLGDVSMCPTQAHIINP